MLFRNVYVTFIVYYTHDVKLKSMLKYISSFLSIMKQYLNCISISFISHKNDHYVSKLLRGI